MTMTIGAATALTAVLVTSTPAAAAPANGRKDCYDTYCQFTSFFGGGTIYVDMDAWNGGDDTIGWQLEGVNTCNGTTTVNAPAQTWRCDNVPSGSWSLKAYSAAGGLHNWAIDWRQG